MHLGVVIQPLNPLPANKNSSSSLFVNVILQIIILGDPGTDSGARESRNKKLGKNWPHYLPLGLRGWPIMEKDDKL